MPKSNMNSCLGILSGMTMYPSSSMAWTACMNGLRPWQKPAKRQRAVRLYEILLSGIYAKIEECDDEC